MSLLKIPNPTKAERKQEWNKFLNDVNYLSNNASVQYLELRLGKLIKVVNASRNLSITREAVGNNITLAYLSQLFTQNMVQSLTGIDGKRIRKIGNGEVDFKYETLVKFAIALMVDVKLFFIDQKFLEDYQLVNDSYARFTSQKFNKFKN